MKRLLPLWLDFIKAPPSRQVVSYALLALSLALAAFLVQRSLGNWRALGYFQRTDREMVFRERGVKQFTESGTVLGMGTDSGTPMNFHTEALWREAKTHVDMGYPAIKVISSLTRIGATILGRQRDLGTIEAGKLADIIVVNGNPLYDITALAHVETVVKGGKIMKRP